MTTTNRILATLFLVTTGLVGVGRMLAVDVTDQFQSEDGPPAVELLSTPTEARAVVRRVEAKSAIIAKLLRGETNLFEAAGRFRRLNSESTLMICNTMLLIPGESLNEKACRQVIFWVTGQLASRASDSEVRKVIERLEEELERHQAEHGRVILPGW